MSNSAPSRALRAIRTLAKRAVHSSASYGVSNALDRMIIRGPQRPAGSTETFVLVPPGDGNIGDMAMVKAVLDNARGPVTLLAEIPDYYATLGVRVLDVRPIIHGWGLRRLRSVREFRRQAVTCGKFYVLGADMMDGGYARTGATRRWALTRCFARLGCDTRVLGFSWNGRPDPVVARAARLAVMDGVEPFLRDPLSFERFTADLGISATESRDVVFAHQWQVTIKPNEERVAVVNASGLIGSRGDQLAEYIEIVTRLRSMGMSVLLVPHVIQEGANDLEELRRLAESFHDDRRVRLVDRLLDPAEVLQLVAGAEVVVTGRMHLSILALSVSTPAVVLSTQGKVQGLLSAVGIPDAAIDPLPGFGARAADAAVSLLSGGPELRTRIKSAAAEARRLAELNFR